MVTRNKRETKGGFVMKIIMLGAPGAGKGTQAKQIAQAYDIPHISTGDIFRANIKEGTELGKKAQEYMDKGLLVPDELVCDLVVDRIHKDDCEKGYILDGFPRTIPQANALDEALAKDGEKIEFAIDIEVPDENIINRMSGCLLFTSDAADEEDRVNYRDRNKNQLIKKNKLRIIAQQSHKLKKILIHEK